MGYTFSWVAVRGQQPQAVLAAFDLADSGAEYEEDDSDYAGAALPGGWFVVVDHGVQEDFTFDYAPEFLARVSAGGEAVYCYDSYEGPVSAAAGWHDGKEVWVLHHLGDIEEADDLEVQGDLPAVFAEIRAGAVGEEEIGATRAMRLCRPDASAPGHRRCPCGSPVSARASSKGTS